MKQIKIIIFSLLILFGILIFCYGALFNSTSVLVQQQDDKISSLARSEFVLIKEVSIGGVKRNDSGDIEQTYTEGQEIPGTCPT